MKFEESAYDTNWFGKASTSMYFGPRLGLLPHETDQGIDGRGTGRASGSVYSGMRVDALLLHEARNRTHDHGK